MQNPGTTSFYTNGGESLPTGVSVTVSNSTTSGSNVGAYTITPTITTSGVFSAPTQQNSVIYVNHQIPTYAPISGTYCITPANLTIKGTQIYNGTNTISSTNLTAVGVNGQTFALTGTGSGDLSSPNVQTNTQLSNLGNLALGTSSNGGLSSNYNPIAITNSNISVLPANLTVTSNTETAISGSPIPVLSGTISGFVDGQTLSGDSGSVSWTTPANSKSGPGSYLINGLVNLGGSYANDYTIVESQTNSVALTILSAPTAQATTTATAQTSTVNLSQAAAGNLTIQNTLNGTSSDSDKTEILDVEETE